MKTRPPAPARDAGARAALAEAIAESIEAEASYAAAVEAQTAARAAKWTALARADAIEKEISQTRVNATEVQLLNLTDALTAAAAAAQQARHVADAAEALTPEEELCRNRAKARLKGAALAVLKAEAGALAEALVADLARAQQDVADRGEALEWLVEQEIVSPARVVTARLYTPPCSWPATWPERVLPGSAPWEAALDALQSDASAALPAWRGSPRR